MASCTDPGYMDYLMKTITTELKRVGIKVQGYNVEQQQQPIHMHSSYQPVSYMSMGVKVNIEFHCNDEQFPYLRPFCQQVDSRREQIPIPAPVSLWGSQAFDPLKSIEYETVILHNCVMTLHASGGSMDEFVESFRKETDKMFLAMESKAFDEEVVDLLTKDEYNQ